MLRSIVVLSCVGVGGIVAIEYLRPNDSNISVIATIIGFLTPTIVAMLGVIKSQENGNAIRELHDSTNHKLGEITDVAASAAIKAAEVERKTDRIAEVTNRTAEVTNQTAQNIEAIKQNGH